MKDKVNILLADGKRRMLESIKERFGDGEYQINTAYDGRGAVKLGADSFMDKPFKRMEILKAVREV